MTLKAITYLTVVVISLVVLPVNAQPVTMRIAYDASKNSSHSPTVAYLKQQIAARMSGKLAVQLFPYGTKLTADSVLDSVVQQKMDFAFPELPRLVNYSQRFKLFDLPFLFYSQAAAERFLRGDYGERLGRSLLGSGFRGVGFLNNGMKQITSIKKVAHPSDMVGLSVGINDSEVLIQQYEQMGAVPVPVTEDKIASVLLRKKTNTLETNWYQINTHGIHELQPFIVESNHAYQGYLAIVSNAFWQSLDEKIRADLKKIIREAVDHGNRVVNQKMEQARKNIIASGKTEVYRLTAEQRQSWAESLRIIWEIFEDDIGTELIKVAASER